MPPPEPGSSCCTPAIQSFGRLIYSAERTQKASQLAPVLGPYFCSRCLKSHTAMIVARRHPSSKQGFCSRHTSCSKNAKLTMVFRPSLAIDERRIMMAKSSGKFKPVSLDDGLAAAGRWWGFEMVTAAPTRAVAGAFRLAWGWLWPAALALLLMGLAVFVLYCLLGSLDQPTTLYPSDY